MGKMRKPFQGVANIIRFNWHFYVLSLGFVLLLLLVSKFLQGDLQFYFNLLSVLIVIPVIISLLISFYIYDLSGLYNLNWLNHLHIRENSKIVNINAGFDETSILLKAKFDLPELHVFDFYDPLKHTEISIKRARKTYPPFPGTRQITTTHIPLEDHTADYIFLIFSAHEIREENERILFFKELRRVIKPSGQIVVTEHLRDPANFLAYTIGFFHFLSKSSWKRTFQSASLILVKEKKLNPFVTTYTLKTHGNSF